MIEEIISRMLFHTVREKLVIEGWIPDIKLFPGIDSNDPDVVETQSNLYNIACKNIKDTKGFCIEVLGFSSNQYRDDKRVARIVIDIQQFLPSETGSDTSVYYEKVTINGKDMFTRKQGIPLLSDLTFTVYAVASNTNQLMIMNNIIMQCLPIRGYVKPLNEDDLLPSRNYFMRLIDKGKTGELPLGIMERYYVYNIPDLQEIGPTSLEGNVPMITEVDIVVP